MIHQAQGIGNRAGFYRALAVCFRAAPVSRQMVTIHFSYGHTMKCFAINCKGNSTGEWNPSNCMRFVTAPQTLKEFLYKAWALVPLDTSLSTTADKVYNRVYAPDAADGDAFPLVGPDGYYRWLNRKYGNLTDRERNKLCYERIYLAITPGNLRTVFNDILIPLADSSHEAIVTMKRCTDHAANSRPDTIVIYTTSSLATSYVLNFLRNCLNAVPDTSPTGPRARVQKMESYWFQAAPPAGTRNVGLQGVGVAQDPGDGDSCGMKLCAAVGEAIDFIRRNHGSLGSLTKTQFACVALGMLSHKGIDPHTPWNLGRESPSYI